MNPQRILVTGGAGFIGSHTVELLLKQGHEVTVLDNLFSGRITNLDLSQDKLEFIEGDVLELPLLEELLQRNDAVLHLAAIASVPYTIDNPIYSFQINTQGLLHVLEAVRRVKPSIRIAYASSAAVYGESAILPCSDEVPLSGEALSPYALQKIHCEHYAALYKTLHGIPSLALRYFNVYGPRQDPASPYSGVISRFLAAFESNTPLTIFGDGQQSRDFIHVSDVAKANALAIQSEYHGALNIATGVPQTLLQMIEYIEKAADKKAQLQFSPSRPGDIKSSYATIEKAKKQLDFLYSISLEEGMKKMLTNPNGK